MPATIKNLSRRSVTITLDRPEFYTDEHGYSRAGRVMIPGSLILRPGDVVSGLNPAISACSQVAQLTARGIIEITQVNDTATTTEETQS